MQNHESQEAREELKTTLARYTELFDFAPAGYLILQPDGSICQANLTAARLLGIERSHLMNRRPAMFVAPEARSAFDALLSRAFTSKAPEVGEVRLSIEGRPPLMVQLWACVSGDRQECRMVMMDITERKQAEENLRQSETKYRRLHQGMRDAFAGVDMNGRLREFNPAFIELLGYSDEELRTMTYMDFTPSRWHAMDAEVVRTQVLPRGYSHIFEKEFRRKDGTILPVEMRVFLVRNGEGQPADMWAIVRDITERKRAEEKIRESETKYRRIVETALEGIWVVNQKWETTYVNPAMAAMLRYGADELIGRLPMEFVIPEDVQMAGVLMEQREKGIVDKTQIGLKRKDGSTMWAYGNSVPLLNDAGEFIGGLSMVTDVTESKRAGEELRASREQLRALAARLQAVREEERTHVAREIHDVLAQELTKLKIDLAWLQRNLAKPETEAPREVLAARISEMSAMTDATIRCVQGIATGLRPAVLDSLGLCAAVDWQARDFQDRTGIMCVVRAPEKELTVGREISTATFRILQEGLTNVLRHAQATKVKILLRQQAARLILRLRDNGRGMPAETLRNPLSIGLAGMRERALLLNGQFEIRSRPGAGTVLEVRFPLPTKAK